MATKTEKTISSALGILAGAYIGYEYSKLKEVPADQKWKYILGFAAGGGALGFGLACLLGSANDTVNYKLMNGKKCVYHGITYEDRVSYRELEHLKCGKEFTRMVTDTPKPRIDALALEKELIIKTKPIYNIQHNC